MKRLLTDEEIAHVEEAIDETVRSTPFLEVRQVWRQRLWDQVVPPLRRIEVYPEVVPQVLRTIRSDIQRALVTPGECVGITCAQSIGERQTQLTLNSFHSAGALTATVVTGVPRFLELLNATKEPKLAGCSFFLPPPVEEHVSNLASVRRFLQYNIVGRTLQDLVTRYTIFLSPSEEIWYSSFEEWYSSDFRHYDIGIKLYLDQETLWRLRLPLFVIASRVRTQLPHFGDVAWSPQHGGQIDVFLDFSDLADAQDDESILSQIEENVIAHFSSVWVCGCAGIRDALVQKTESGRFQVMTTGSNLLDLLGHPDVESSTCRSNHLWETYQCLGIEATRQFLFEELQQVVSSDGTFLHPSHLLLLVDFMTYHGIVTSVSRYGMKKESNGPLSKASFEEVMDHFLTAAFTGEVESIDSISASIICGKRSRAGTGLCDLLANVPRLPRVPTPETPTLPVPCSNTESSHRSFAV